MVQNEIKMRKPKSRELIHALVQDWRLYVLLLPVVLWFALWAYKPMGGLLIAFKRYDSSLGIWMSEFKGIDNFVNLVAGVNKEQFWQAFRNTFVINAYSLVFGFPVPIILAVLFSEIGNGFVRKATQTATYLPHFLSEVTITGITIMLVYSGVHSTGVLAALFQNMGWLEEGVSMLSKANYFRPLYIAVGIWKESGYSSIVYFAAIMGISPTLYEAMKVDGANEFQLFYKIYVPMSTASIATVTLFYAISRWNGYYWSRMLLTDPYQQPLQVYLRQLIENYQKLYDESPVVLSYSADSLAYAIIICSIIPVLAIYPYIQKYFAKGVNMGGVKG